MVDAEFDMMAIPAMQAMMAQNPQFMAMNMMGNNDMNNNNNGEQKAENTQQ